LPLLPLLGIGAALLIPYGCSLSRRTSRARSLVQRIRVLGRSSALAMAMAFEILISSVKPLFKAYYTWSVTPKGPNKRSSKSLPRPELIFSLLLLSTLIMAILRSYVVLTLWSLACLAPFVYVVFKRFG